MQSAKQPLYQFLQSSGIISHAKATEIAEHFNEKIIDKNEFFLREGQLSNEYLILAEGFIRAYSFSTEGSEVTTAFYSPIQPVFEVASFFNRTHSKENLQALILSKGWVITFTQLNQLFHALPEFREFGRNILVKGFASLKIRMLSMISETAEQRYAALLQANPEVFQQAPLKHIASYLGITDTSLSRIRKEMMRRD